MSNPASIIQESPTFRYSHCVIAPFPSCRDSCRYTSRRLHWTKIYGQLRCRPSSPSFCLRHPYGRRAWIFGVLRLQEFLSWYVRRCSFPRYYIFRIAPLTRFCLRLPSEPQPPSSSTQTDPSPLTPLLTKARRKARRYLMIYLLPSTAEKMSALTRSLTSQIPPVLSMP